MTNRIFRVISLAVLTAILAPAVLAQGQQQGSTSTTASSEKEPEAKDGRTPGRVAKFGNRGRLNDANISEDSAGRIGVNTTTPTAPLTVNGMVETVGAQGGFKFPDGSVQQTAAVVSTISRDSTLQGNGTAASPLGVAIPFKLNTFVQFGSVVEISNGNVASHGITSTGGADGGIGLRGIGANGGIPGSGVIGIGGFSSTLTGGFGVGGSGGGGDSGNGGVGLSGGGGSTNSGTGGSGVEAGGGRALVNGIGGIGGRFLGGQGRGAGKRGGNGIETFGGEGFDGATPGLAAKFNGNVEVTGNLSKAGGSFIIDHPLDPKNKYLSHSFVESPDMKNIYDGVVTLNESGETVIEMPEWFGALNRDFRYLLTALGAPMPGLYIAEELSNNRFKISGGVAMRKVSWQVTGIRQDAWANQNRIKVEEDKPEKERGNYLHPEAFGQPNPRPVAAAQPRLER